MNRFAFRIFAGAAMLVGLSAQVQAGGMYAPEGSYKDPVSAAVAVPAPMPIPETTAWYIRGDLGYLAYQEPDVVESGQYDLVNTNIDGTWSVGGGIGYYFTSRLRGDVSVEYIADSQFTGTNTDTTAPIGGGVREFDFRSTVALANVYYDFDRYGRFSPYVGVGIGVAFNQTSAGQAFGVGGATGSIAGASENSFALALMGGSTFQIRTGLHLDANYRYLYLGDAHTGDISPTGATTVGAGDPVFDDIHVHQIRVGLRQDIW